MLRCQLHRGSSAHYLGSSIISPDWMITTATAGSCGVQEGFCQCCRCQHPLGRRQHVSAMLHRSAFAGRDRNAGPGRRRMARRHSRRAAQQVSCTALARDARFCCFVLRCIPQLPCQAVRSPAGAASASAAGAAAVAAPGAGKHQALSAGEQSQLWLCSGHFFSAEGALLTQ